MYRTSILLFAVLLSFNATATEFNLQERADAGGITFHNREFKTAPKELPGVVYLTQAAGDGLAWIEGVELAEGLIEVDVRGANRPGQSFVGIAFRGVDDETFDCVYVRPFNFQNPDRRKHSLQYISMPENDWSALRQAFPEKYESALDPSPQPESWVHLKLQIEQESVNVYINGLDTPQLIVALLSEQRSGKVGLWVGNGSEGEFQNLSVVPKASPGSLAEPK